MSNLIKISQFSELIGLSVRTLQYYDEIGLLSPMKVDEHGHRYYGNDNFIKGFIINSLKNVGMSLTDIKNYLSKTDFSMSDFVKEEKKRIEDELTILQHKLIMLENIESYGSIFSLTEPAFIPLFSQGDLTPLELERIVGIPTNQLAFDLAETSQFIKDLDDCRVNQLTIDDPLAQKCALYWQRILEFGGEGQESLTKAAEKKYQMESNTYGMTEANYYYLTSLIEDCD